jgi:hypothetical protein
VIAGLTIFVACANTALFAQPSTISNGNEHRNWLPRVATNRFLPAIGSQSNDAVVTEPPIDEIAVIGNENGFFHTPTDRRVFRLRHHRIQPEQFFGTSHPEYGVTRTWFFESKHDHWVQTEHQQRELAPYFYRPAWRVSGDLLSDAEYFYSRELAKLSGPLVIAAVLANTSMDENFYDYLIQQKATEPYIDCWYDSFGNGQYLLAASLSAWGAGHLWNKYHDGGGPIANSVEQWGNVTFRSFVVGAPTLVLIQNATGGSRPGESSHGSEWRFFQDDNGASGHAYVGAIPFLVAAKMSKRPLVKAAFFAGSGLAGYARLCNDSHYLSQVILGWSIAHLAVNATWKSETSCSRYRLVPLDLHGSYGLGIEIRR